MTVNDLVYLTLPGYQEEKFITTREIAARLDIDSALVGDALGRLRTSGRAVNRTPGSNHWRRAPSDVEHSEPEQVPAGAPRVTGPGEYARRLDAIERKLDCALAILEQLA